MSAVELVKRFDVLMATKNFDRAAELLEDDIVVTTPMGTKDKTQWLASVKKEGPPNYEEPEEGSDELEVVTNGSKRMGFITVKVIRTMLVNDSKTKINSLVLRKA
jgi:hypothetical protein